MKLVPAPEQGMDSTGYLAAAMHRQGVDKCYKCTQPLRDGGCKCNDNCDCTHGTCYKCEVPLREGGCKCNSSCACIDQKCDKCALPANQGGCKCNSNCDCVDNKCDKCNVPAIQGGCACDANCDCTGVVDKCLKCQRPARDGGCKCNENCDCIGDFVCSQGVAIPAPLSFQQQGFVTLERCALLCFGAGVRDCSVFGWQPQRGAAGGLCSLFRALPSSAASSAEGEAVLLRSASTVLCTPNATLALPSTPVVGSSTGFSCARQTAPNRNACVLRSSAAAGLSACMQQCGGSPQCSYVTWDSAAQRCTQYSRALWDCCDPFACPAELLLRRSAVTTCARSSAAFALPAPFRKSFVLSSGVQEIQTARALYLLDTDALPWREASAKCVSRGGRLAAFRDGAEWSTFMDALAAAPPNPFLPGNFLLPKDVTWLPLSASLDSLWLGASRRTGAGGQCPVSASNATSSLAWPDGTSLAGGLQQRFAGGEPNAINRLECCVASTLPGMTFLTSVYAWWDAPCTVSFPFVCQLRHPAPPPRPPPSPPPRGPCLSIRTAAAASAVLLSAQYGTTPYQIWTDNAAALRYGVDTVPAGVSLTLCASGDVARFNRPLWRDCPASLARPCAGYAPELQPHCFCSYHSDGLYQWPLGPQLQCKQFVQCAGRRAVGGGVRQCPRDPVSGLQHDFSEQATGTALGSSNATRATAFNAAVHCPRASLTNQCSDRCSETGCFCAEWLLPDGVYLDPYDTSGSTAFRCVGTVMTQRLACNGTTFFDKATGTCGARPPPCTPKSTVGGCSLTFVEDFPSTSSAALQSSASRHPLAVFGGSTGAPRLLGGCNTVACCPPQSLVAQRVLGCAHRRGAVYARATKSRLPCYCQYVPGGPPCPVAILNSCKKLFPV